MHLGCLASLDRRGNGSGASGMDEDMMKSPKVARTPSWVRQTKAENVARSNETETTLKAS